MYSYSAIRVDVKKGRPTPCGPLHVNDYNALLDFAIHLVKQSPLIGETPRLQLGVDRLTTCTHLKRPP